MKSIEYYVLSALVVLITLTVHEYSHGYAAYKLGDPTANSLGRLTLNPIKHIDPIGAIFMLFFHIGWAKPVPINPRYFKKPKRDFAITALAGPLSNLILAYISALIFLLIVKLFGDINIQNMFISNLLLYTVLFFQLLHLINIGIALFNLIPIPPLDGSRILNVILPQRIYFGIMKHERKIYLGLVAWIFFGGIASDALLSLPIASTSPVITVIAKCLSFSNIMGYAIDFVSNIMLRTLSFLR